MQVRERLSDSQPYDTLPRETKLKVDHRKAGNEMLKI